MQITFLMPPLEVSPYCWLMEIGPRKIGVHRHDGWCMQLDARLVFFDSEDKCMPLAPILEIETKEFADFLKTVEISAPEYSEAVRRFPKKLLLKHVFRTSVSGYWPERALTWLIDDDNLQPLFEGELKKIIDSKVMPQNARHRATKIVNSLQSKKVKGPPISRPVSSE